MPQEKQRGTPPDAEQVADQEKRRAEPGAGGPARREDADARGDKGKLRKNQERLGVGPEHKTDAMKKGRRGTFP